MSLLQQQAKYINLTLADLLERALKYKRLSEQPSRSARDKSVWKAVAIDAARAYNSALKSLGLVATSKIAQEQSPLVLSNSSKFADLLDEEDMQQVITEAYGSSLEERKEHRKSKNLEFLQAIAARPEIALSVATLAKQVRNTQPQAKGGIVRSLIAKGIEHGAANVIADQRLDEQALQQESERIAQELITNPELNAALQQAGVETTPKDKLTELGHRMMGLI